MTEGKISKTSPEYKEERKQILHRPHEYIKAWMEANLLHVGSRVFQLMALQPCSLILPDIPFGSTNIRSNFNVLFLSPPSSGKCLRKDTDVMLSDGTYKKVQDVNKDDLVFSINDKTLKIGKSRVLENVLNGRKMCFKIKTRTGKEIFLTENHPLLKITGWEQLRNLKCGDYIALPRKIKINPSSNLQDDTIKLLAYLITEGSLKGSVSFTNENKEILDEFSECIYSFSDNLKIKSYSKKNTEAKHLKISSVRMRCKNGTNAHEKNDLSLFLGEIGLFGKGSYTKIIPDCILSLDKSKLSVFLNRLFACDGCVSLSKKIPIISYSSASKLLIYQVSDLLLRFEVLSKIRRKKNKLKNKIFISYELEILPSTSKRFIREIGLIIGKERNCLKVLKYNQSREFMDTIPKEIWGMIKASKNNNKNGWREITKHLNKKTGQVNFHTEKNPSRNTIAKIKLDISFKYSSSDIFWDRIVKIEKIGEEGVYDLMIEGNHNFVANGFFVHNSTICKKYATLAFNPYVIRKVSSAKLYDDISKMKMFSLILEDFSQVGNDYDVIKVIEQALGDEKRINKRTMREEIDLKTQGVGILCGTWSDLSRYLDYFKGGLLFRLVLLFVELDQQQRQEIAQYINEGIGNKKNSTKLEIKEKVIKDYYQELFSIQAGEHKTIQQVKDYHFPEEIRTKIIGTWEKLMATIKQDLEFEFTRELHEGYRFLISSAFLNVHNRKLEEGVLYPNEEDYALSKELMTENFKNKLAILESRSFLNQRKSALHLKTALESKIPSRTKKVLVNLAKNPQ